MSTTNPAPAQMTVPSWPRLPQAVRYLAQIAAHAIASAVLMSAARQAHRELAALDDRMLADIGLVRAELTSLLEALAEARTAGVLAQFPWNRPRMGA
jgi:uncharacterized protein YjiS (DUF1127 family)